MALHVPRFFCAVINLSSSRLPRDQIGANPASIDYVRRRPVAGYAPESISDSAHPTEHLAIVSTCLAVFFVTCAKILYRLGSGLSRSDTNTVIHRQDKNLTIADLALLASSSTLHNGIDRGLNKLFIDGNLQLYFTK